MKVIESSLRAVIERVTEIEIDLYGTPTRLFVFENLNKQAKTCGYRIQNWECDDITDSFNYDDQRRIMKSLQEHYSSREQLVLA